MSQQNTHLPKFGNWDGTVPYTQYFENARKGRMEGKIMNPNDPVENPEAFSAVMQPVHPPSPVALPHSRARKPKGRLQGNKEDDSGSFRRSEDPHNHRHRNQTSPGNLQRRSNKVSGSGSNDRGNNSPLRPNYRMNDGGYSSAEGLSETSQAFTSATRLRMTNVRDDKNVKIKKGSSLPKFGEWDESNPASADDFSDIFNKVREDQHTGPAQVANISSTRTTLDNAQKSPASWCFGWFFGCCKK